MSQIGIFTCIITANMKHIIEISAITPPRSSSSYTNHKRMSKTPASQNIHSRMIQNKQNNNHMTLELTI